MKMTGEVKIDTGNRNYLDGLGNFLFSFSCYKNIFKAKNEMKINNKTALKIKTMPVLATVSAVYSTFGLFNYLTLGDSITKESFVSKGSMENIMSTFYLLVILMSIPLQTNPCNAYFIFDP